VSDPLRAYDAMVHDYSYVHMVEYDMLRFQETLHAAPLSAALRNAQRGKSTSHLPRVRIYQSAKVCYDNIALYRYCVGVGCAAAVGRVTTMHVGKSSSKSCRLIRTLSGAARPEG
jgi:hypothetical protein